jgi:tetratricopeptide (TPR) repeat protein
MLAAMSSFASLVHSTSAVVPVFNADFYVTVATLIPVLFIALALQSRVWEDIVRIFRGATLRYRDPAVPVSQQLAAVARSVAMYVIATLIVAAGAVGEIAAVLALYNRHESAKTASLVLGATVFLTIATAAGPWMALLRASYQDPQAGETAAVDAESPTTPTRTALSHDHGGDRTQAAWTAFKASYPRLDAQQARLFRLLALNPVPDTATEAAAALAGVPAGQARSLLAALARTSLVAEQPPGRDRWRMHDLIRPYAADLGRDAATADKSEAALSRLLEHYRSTAAAADQRLRTPVGQAVPGPFGGYADALAWLDAERPALVAAVPLAVGSGSASTAISLAMSLAFFLEGRGYFDDMITTGQVAVAAARDAGDQQSEAAALDHLGVALRETRRCEEAIAAHQQAAAIFAEAGDERLRGMALDHLGVALRETRRCEEAIAAHQQAVAIFAELGDRVREGMAMDNLGIALRETRQLYEAIAAHQQAAAIFAELGDRVREGMALDNLGVAQRQKHDYYHAMVAGDQAVAIFTALGDQRRQGIALDNLGSTLGKMRRFYGKAIEAHRQAAAIFAKLGEQHSEGVALDNLGVALRQARRFDEATAAHQQAAVILAGLGEQNSQA